jgi:hypothetical protein
VVGAPSSTTDEFGICVGIGTSTLESGGRPVKWLGDGVMVYFRDPGSGRGCGPRARRRRSVRRPAARPRWPARRTGPLPAVNLASRIAEYARPGEVLVSQEVVDASAGVDVTFTEIGPVELKGISGVRLHAAHRAEAH